MKEGERQSSVHSISQHNLLSVSCTPGAEEKARNETQETHYFPVETCKFGKVTELLSWFGNQERLFQTSRRY
jgi:hypothetical protein